MAGEFHVTFSFEETESLKPGYTVKPPYRTAGSEVVQILDETPRKIVLQHVLVLAGPNGTPVAQKHWRQDWTFQDDDLVEFRGRRSFSHRHLSANEVRCAWSQAVFEVTDAPRYESVGRWTHAGGVSTWASAETWRPLPRREYTKRSDYDVIVGTNRHVVSDSGWSHEQDNVKLVLDGNHPLARERGLNRYERTSLATAEVARAYLRETGAFWSGVRDAWRDAFARNERFVIRPDDAIAEPHEDLFTLARASAGGNVEARVARARALIDRAVQPSGGPAHASLSQMAPH